MASPFTPSRRPSGPRFAAGRRPDRGRHDSSGRPEPRAREVMGCIRPSACQSGYRDTDTACLARYHSESASRPAREGSPAEFSKFASMRCVTSPARPETSLAIPRHKAVRARSNLARRNSSYRGCSSSRLPEITWFSLRITDIYRANGMRAQAVGDSRPGHAVQTKKAAVVPNTDQDGIFRQILSSGRVGCSLDVPVFCGR
jgi:hypothetical protein